MSGMQVTAKIEAGKVRQSLHNLGDAIPKIGRRRFKQTMEQARYEASGGYTGGASYSIAAPPRPSYERTGTYGRSFGIRDNGGLSYTLQSDAVQRGNHYTTAVGGNASGQGQAAVHVGRWPKIADSVRKWLGQLLQDIEADLAAVLRQEGMGL